MIFYFSDSCAEQYKNHKNFLNLCHHQQDFNMDAELIFFATSHGKSSCDGVGGFVKHFYVAECSLQRHLNEQILSYQSMFYLEIPSITFFQCKSGRNGQCLRWPGGSLEQGVATIFYQYLATKLLKLTSEDREFLQFDFNKLLSEEIDIKNINCFLYVSCIYNTFWWVDIMTVKWIYMMVIWILNFFTYMNLSAGHLLLIKVLPQHQTSYATLQLQKRSLGECIRSQSLTLNKLWKHMKTIKYSHVYMKL